jgi:hypothetical protein
MMQSRRYPTPEEVHAIEQAARQARAQAIAQLFAAALGQLKALIVRGATALASTVRRARELARHGT